MGACYDHLSYVDRLSIDEGRRGGLSLRAIARKLKRAPSTVSRDIKRMGPYQPGYDAPSAFFGALRRRRESRKGGRKLHPDSALFAHCAEQLRAGWSPLQIAGRLRRMDEADRPGTANLGTVSHETIYSQVTGTKTLQAQVARNATAPNIRRRSSSTPIGYAQRFWVPDLSSGRGSRRNGSQSAT